MAVPTHVEINGVRCEFTSVSPFVNARSTRLIYGSESDPCILFMVETCPSGGYTGTAKVFGRIVSSVIGPDPQELALTIVSEAKRMWAACNEVLG